MARLPQRTSLRVHIQLGSLFSLLCLCTSLLSPSGMTTMAETQELVCLQLRGVCWACSLFLLPIARPQNCCSFLYTMWTGWKENYSPYPFHERRNWWNARLWLAQGVTQCLVSPMFSWICSWSPTWVLCTCNLLWKECLFLLLWKRKKEKCNSMLLLSQ